MSASSDDAGLPTPSTTEENASTAKTEQADQLSQEKKTSTSPTTKPFDGDSSDSEISDTEERAKLGHVAHQVSRVKTKKKDRIEELEKLVQKLTSEQTTLSGRITQLQASMGNSGGIVEADPDRLEEPNSRLVKCRLNPQYWKKFQDAPSKKTVYPIDVLVGEPVLPRARKKWSVAFSELERDGDDYEEQQEQPTLDSALDESKRNAQKEFERIKGSAMPERIRLSIFAIQYLLRKILDRKTGIPHGYSSRGVIMLRPYKPLFLGEARLRSQLSKLKKRLQNFEDQRKGSASSENPPQARESDSMEVEQKPVIIELKDLKTILLERGLLCCEDCTLLLHDNFQTTLVAKDIIQCLLDFMDDYLKPVHNDLRQRSRRHVTFSELWHVFQPGDEIIMKPKEVLDDEPTWHTSLLRVLRVQGGRPHLYPKDIAPFISGVHAVQTIVPPPPPPAGTPAREIAPPRPKPINGIIPFTIDAYYLDFNGQRVTPIRRRFFIESYPGLRDVEDLDVYPAKFAFDSDPSFTRDTLISRGRKFLDYIYSKAASHVECRGEELQYKEDLREQLVVDMRECWKWSTNARPIYLPPEELDVAETSDCYLVVTCREGPDCRHRKTRIFSDQYVDKEHMDDHVETRRYLTTTAVIQPKQQPNLPENDLAICTFRVHAWALQSRKWVQVHVDQLHDVGRVNEDVGFDLLVLPGDHKQIIKAQVQEHFRKKILLGDKADRNLDLVRGKGQGLIILLHGAPGVGKTATAECIADLVQRPLYPITCGDLGSTALEIEKELSRHFDRASRWDCVMLLDEADVFLARRSREDHARNAIVSVFLRMLEYYKGILFLTTNRIGTFDEAFKSRIHISLFYPDFDEDATISVWETFIKQTDEANKDRPNFHIDSKSILKFARKHFNSNSESSRWNGRQIRNAFHTGIAMAEYEARTEQAKAAARDKPRDPLDYGKDVGDVKVVLGKHQFKAISSTVRQFDDYIKETLGGTWEEAAENNKLRTAKFKTEKKKSKKVKSKSKHDNVDSSDSSSSEDKPRKKKSSKKVREISSSSSDSD